MDSNTPLLHRIRLCSVCRCTVLMLALAIAVPAVASAQTIYTWTGGGSDNNWNTAANWSPGAVGSGNGTVLVFSGSTRTSPNNTSPDWNFNLGRLEFATGAAPFTLTGNNIGFQRYLNTQKQEIFQNSANTQTIGWNAFSFQPGTDSQINLNAGDLVISSPNVYIDSVDNDVRSLYVTGNDSTRRTVTLAGNLNKTGGGDPDIYIQNNKRLLVTGSITTGSGNDGSIFIDSGVLEFGSTGAMTGGSPVVGAPSDSGTAAVYLNAAGSTFARQIEIRGGSSGQRIVGGLDTSGTVTYSGNFVATNAPADYDLKAATGGTVNVSGARNLNTLLHVNRDDGGTTFGGTVILSGTTNSTQGTGLYAGPLEFGDFNQLSTGYFAFERDTGDSGTLRYTGGSTSITKQFWVNKAQTRAAIDVVQAGTTLTWTQDGGQVNRNVTKTGAGTLVFDGAITGSNGNVVVEAGRLVLSGSSSSYSGGSTVTGGTLEVSANGSAGGSAAGLGTGLVSIGSGGQVTWYLSLSGSQTIANAFSLSGGTLYTEDGANTFSGLVTLASGSSTIAARYEDTITLSGGLAGSGNLLFTQAGGTGNWAAPTYVLSAAGSNTGTVRVSGSSGLGATRLQLANVNALQSATLDLASGDQGTVEFTVSGSNTYALGGLQGSRNLALGSNSLSVGGNGSSTTYTGALSGSGSLTKTGSGTLTLTGSNGFTGGAVVSAGRLSVNGGLGNTAVTVQAGGMLGGSGSIGGAVVVDGLGTLSPGNSIASLAVGATTFTGTSEFLGGSTFEYEYDSSAALSVGADLLVVSGSLTIGAGSLITFADLAGSPTPFADGTIFALINYSGAWNNGLFTYDGTALADGSRFLVGSQEWEIDYNRASSAGLANYTGDYLPSSSFVAITAVPEPSAVCLAVTAAGLFSLFRRFRNHTTSSPRDHHA